MSVTYPRGFRAAGVTAGFKPSGQPDLALLVGDPGTTAVGLFTTNRVAAAPVGLSRARLSTSAPRAVLVNSGQANAATGARGDADAAAATDAAAAALALVPEEMLHCSTGVIGEPLHIEQLLDVLPKLVAALGADGGDDFARAIMTTDSVEKVAAVDACDFRVGGCAKGVGMIAPNLATMLAFVTTDAPVSEHDLQRLADEQLKPRFNALTVDDCTSTNDTVLLFASGVAAGADVASGSVAPGSSEWTDLSGGVAAVGESLVRQLIADGEGANHVLLIEVGGAGSEADARVVAKAVAGSALVKTAAFGCDPNPGRIQQAIGSSGVGVDPGRIDVSIGDVRLATRGVIPPAYFEDPSTAEAARGQMTGPEIHIAISLGDGPGSSRAFGCDLSYDYVRINGEYTT
ncbi:MAG: bifunctional glutamate N-acetyltransferase/amino-acid acetyltransferase ArgJ [Actinomycetota bacterium]|nr:bifunctional glutamate N-acetyltransferase/amino-acid acetyltransferase ArgJ [Actinomycetota bacterium]